MGQGRSRCLCPITWVSAGRGRTDADTRQLSRMLKGLQGVIREQRWSSGPIPVEQR